MSKRFYTDLANGLFMEDPEDVIVDKDQIIKKEDECWEFKK